MADDGWTTVGASKKKNVAPSNPSATKLSPIPKPVGLNPLPQKKTTNPVFAASGSRYAAPKYGAGTNKKASVGPTAKKIEALAESEEGSLAAKKVDHNVSQNIMRARQAKGWTQKDLSREAHESPAVIRDYENGKAVHNGAVIAKFEKVLGKLR